MIFLGSIEVLIEQEDISFPDNILSYILLNLCSDCSGREN